MAPRVTADLPLAGAPPSVLLDGEEVTGVVGFAVKAEPGMATRVFLTLEADVELAGEGVVHVVDGVNVLDAVRGWLGQIEPDVLSKAVLDRLGPGSGRPTDEVLAVLREWASA